MEANQGNGNEMLTPFAHAMHRPHNWCNSVRKIQAAIGPYIEIERMAMLINGYYDGFDVWVDQVASVNISYKVHYQVKGKEEDKRKDGKLKVTSESGQAYTWATVREQPRTVRDGRRLSPVLAVGYWPYDTGGSRKQVTGNYHLNITPFDLA